MSTVKSKKLQVGTDATSSNNFTIYQPATPDGTLRIGVGNADSPTEVARFDATGMISGYPDTTPDALSTATGSAPSYSARAWVVYNPQTQTILSSGNVSSVTYTATGRFTVNLQTAMPDANFATMGIVGQNDSATGNHSLCEYSALRTSSAIGVISSTVGGTETNEPYWSLTVFR